MKPIKILTILTLVFNSFILIGFGHGFGPLILTEVLLFSPRFVEGSEIGFIGNYNEKIIPFSIINFIFQILLFITLFIKPTLKNKLINISSSFLILNLIYFTFDFTESNLSRLTIVSGIPFLIINFLLMFKNIQFYIGENN